MTLISPKLNTVVCYRVKVGKWPDLKNPSSFKEKLIKLKLEDYNYDPLVRQCADKFAVRAFVKERIGRYPERGGVLNELIAVYNSPEQIEWDSLPDCFAIKWNFGCGNNIIVQDKNKLNIPNTVKTLKKFGKRNPWIGYSELQYKGVNKKLIIEKFLGRKDATLPEDYKIYCFNGKAKAILYVAERDSVQHRAVFFDTGWNYLGETGKAAYKKLDNLPSAPFSLDEMVSVAEILAEGFPFVRVDFYDVDGQAVFGEMTFTPAGACDVSEIDINGVSMGEMLSL